MLSSDQSTFAMLIAMSVSDTFNGANPSLARSWFASLIYESAAIMLSRLVASPFAPFWMLDR